jgi:hypothetical protein
MLSKLVVALALTAATSVAATPPAADVVDTIVDVDNSDFPDAPAIVVSAPAPAMRTSYANVGSCTVSLRGTGFSSLALRPTPCNNRQPIMMLPNGLRVLDLGGGQKYGCGYYYKRVEVRGRDGRAYKGWVGTDYVQCGRNPLPPTPPPNPFPRASQSCGTFCVKNGGPTNCCGDGGQYTAASYNTCNTDGSDCYRQCCSDVILY